MRIEFGELFDSLKLRLLHVIAVERIDDQFYWEQYPWAKCNADLFFHVSWIPWCWKLRIFGSFILRVLYSKENAFTAYVIYVVNDTVISLTSDHRMYTWPQKLTASHIRTSWKPAQAGSYLQALLTVPAPSLALHPHTCREFCRSHLVRRQPSGNTINCKSISLTEFEPIVTVYRLLAVYYTEWRRWAQPHNIAVHKISDVIRS